MRFGCLLTSCFLPQGCSCINILNKFRQAGAPRFGCGFVHYPLQDMGLVVLRLLGHRSVVGSPGLSITIVPTFGNASALGLDIDRLSTACLT